MKFGKLSPTNDGAMQVYADALKGTRIMARLLLRNGTVFFEGPLQITKGKFINAPKVRGWIRACGRNRGDLAGRANERNIVYAFRTGDGTYCLHFAELLGGTSSTRVDARDSLSEQPNQSVGAERLAALVADDFYENRLDLSSRSTPPDGASWDSMPEVGAARQLRDQRASDDAVRLFVTFVAAMDRLRDAASLWRAALALFRSRPEIFDPGRVADLPFSTLKRLLAATSVSKMHEPDTQAWHRIAQTLATGDESPVYTVIHRGIGDAEELLKARRQLPMLRGEKIGPMWIRMLAEPGGATIARMATIPVAVDVHVYRITKNLGVASVRDLRPKTAKRTIQAAWQAAVAAANIGGPSRIAGTCSALDPALWAFGKYGCSHCEKVGMRVPIGRACDHCQLPT